MGQVEPQGEGGGGGVLIKSHGTQEIHNIFLLGSWFYNLRICISHFHSIISI